jgi:predicted amidophosphoribosyltransferase
MNLMNCSGCGKLQLASYTSLCPDCLKHHVDDSHRIRAYLQQHPLATVMELSRDTGLPLKKINELVKR